MVVDLEIGKQQARAFTGLFVQAERLLEAKNSGVKLAGGRQIVGSQSDVGDADNGGRDGKLPAGRAGAVWANAGASDDQKGSEANTTGQGQLGEFSWTEIVRRLQRTVKEIAW